MTGNLAKVPLEVLLARAGAAVARHRQRRAAEHGLTPTSIAVLSALDPEFVPEPGPSHRDLAGWLGLSPATLTPVIDVLERAGEVRRDRDPGDRRIVRLHRTDAGGTHLAAVDVTSRLPLPGPEIEPGLRTYLGAVLAAVEAEE